jgi:hypothetical protein
VVYLCSLLASIASAQPTVVPPATLPANPPPGAPAANSLQSIRRIFVPQQDLEAEIRGLLPVKRADLERRLAPLQAEAAPADAPPTAVISQAHYQGTLRGDQITGGTARLTISRPATEPSSSYLPLVPCTLAVGAPNWQMDDEEPRGPVVWGVSDKQKLVVAVSRPGTLEFPWSLRGKRDERGRVHFEWEVPVAARQTFELAVPGNLLLSSTTCVLRERATKGEGNSNRQSEASPDSIWEIDAPAGLKLDLVVQPRQEESQTEPLVIVRETSSYVFTSGQVDLELSLELDIDRAPLREIRVRYDSRLRWTAVRWGEQSLGWTVEKSAMGEPLAVIALPEPLTGTSRLIQLTAIADWTPQDKKWDLPRATVENAVWQEGRANVAAPRWLQLDAAAGAGSRLTATTLASEIQGADLLQFQLEHPAAVIEVQTALPTLPLDALSMLTLHVEPKQLVAQVAAELTATSGSLFSIDCEIPRSWVIDSIETVPADLLEDRIVRPRANLQVNTLVLKQPLRPGRPLRIQARLRHVRGPGAESWNDDILQPLRFVSVTSQQRYVTLQLADASFEPRLLSADGLEFLAAASLPAKARTLLDSSVGTWLVRLTDNARSPRFLLAPGSSRYSSDSLLQVNLLPQRADYHLNIRCEPESSAVSNVLVQIRPAPAADPNWRLEGDPRNLLAERLETMVTGADQPGPALYRIELPRARDASFSISAQWQESLAGETYAPLVELPEASTHIAQVELLGPLDTPVTWQVERLRPMPVPATATQIRARYRYQAGQESRLKLLPLLESQRTLAGWITRCEIETWFSPTGAARHEARYLIAGDDVEALELRLAANARLARAVVDGREVLAFSQTSDPRWLSIPLRNPNGPRSQTSPLVRLEFTSLPGENRGWLYDQWSAPIPETRLPVLQSYWHATLPTNWLPWPNSQLSERTNSAWTEGRHEFWSLIVPNQTVAEVSRDLPDDREVRIAVYSPAWLALLALVLAVIVAAVAIYCADWSSFQVLALALSLLALTIFTPPPLSIFVQAAMAGWLTGFVLQTFRRSVKAKSVSASSASTTFLIQPVPRVLILGLISSATFLAGDWSRWPDLQAADMVSANKSWRLVIPVDDDREPTGDYVYVSPPLWEVLFRQSTLSVAGQPEWLIRNAQYDLRWRTTIAENTEFQGIVARYEVDVLRPGSTLRLPFLREQVRLIEPGVRIEGEAAAATWTPAGDALLVDTDPQRTGRQRVEIGLALLAPPQDGLTGTAIRVPRIPDSRVSLPTQSTAEKVTIPSARGAEQAVDGSAWQVDLGPTDQLSVQWTRGLAEPAPVMEAEQLLLWRLRPSSVVVDGKWEFRPLSGRLREVVVRADSRFRLLPTGNGSQVVKHWVEEGESNLHHFTLDRATTGEVSLTASFLLVGSTGIGNLTPPRLEAVADRNVRDWQAAWLAPGLQWNGKTGTLTSTEFLQQWGDSAVGPLHAFRSGADGARPTLAVSAVQNRLQANQQMEWSLTPDLTSVRYRLQGPAAPANLAQLRFQLLPQLTVRRVVVTQGETTVASRWFRHADGVLTLLLDEVRAEPWQVDIYADRPHVAGKTTNLPVLQASDIDVQRYECVIRRRPGAAVTLGKIQGWKPLSNTASNEAESAGDRVIAELAWSASRAGALPPQIPLTLAAALPASAGELLTRLVSRADGWEVELSANLNAPQHSFDELQFSIPRDWTGPFELEPAGRWQIELLPGQARSLLRVQLNEPVKDQLRFRMRAPLTAEQELVRLPVIDLIGSHILQRWIALPKQSNDSRLQWQTAGLQSRPELPTAFGGTSNDTDLAFEVIIDRYRASARPERLRREQPRITLADHHVIWQNDRRTVGRSEFAIVPGGAKSILIEPPAAHELVAVIVNDVPGQLRPERGISGAATVELHSDSWPQWIQVIYRGRLPIQEQVGGKWEFSSPRVANVPVERTRWQVNGPLPLQPPLSLSQSDDNDPLAPLEALAKLARGATDNPAGNLAESVDTWLRLWRRHWDREQAVIRKRAPSSPLAPVVAARLQALENEMDDLLTLPLESTAGESNPLQAITPREVLFTQPIHELRVIRAQDMPTWTVIAPNLTRPHATSNRWFLGLSLLTGAAIVTQLGRSVHLRDWIAAYSSLVLMALGVAALLIPGYFGLGALLLVLSLAAAFHSPWRLRA